MRSRRPPPAPDITRPIVNSAFNHQLLELASANSERLGDPDGLSALMVAAAGAIGMPALGPPVVRQGSGDIAIALLCREGHIVLHSVPSQGICLVDIFARVPLDVGKGLDVITRRLAS
jgi:S-adenosylmethionine/arginine decarboxylase-like enzyme